MVSSADFNSFRAGALRSSRFLNRICSSFAPRLRGRRSGLAFLGSLLLTREAGGFDASFIRRQRVRLRARAATVGSAFPPDSFIAGVMDLTMVSPAQCRQR